MVSVSDEVSTYSKEASSKMFQDAEVVIPGGVTANIKHFAPFPIFMKEGRGSKLIDVDNMEYIDYSLCYGALITGHGHPQIMQAAMKQMNDTGTIIFGTPHELEIKMAKKLIELYPSMEQIRYTNSGTEAILLAIRLAVAYTKKSKIAKFEGHYHGGINQVLVSVNPSPDSAGHAKQPTPVTESSGIPSDETDNTIVLPFNDLEATETILREHKDELAAVILEPVQGGFIPAKKEFIHGLKKLTDELGIVLIFDEVKTGFRVALGGAQSVYGVEPDITALGKVLGGGFPVGAVGGKKELMMQSAANAKGDVFAVGGDSDKTRDVVFHSGTYNGHPIVLAAGLETIRLLEEGNLLNVLFSHTKHLRSRLEKLYASYHIEMKTIGMGSIFNIIFTTEPIKNYRDMWQANTAFREAIDQELLHLGVYLKPLNRYSMSIAHTLEDIDRTVDAHEVALNNVLKNNYRTAK
ncbi:aspartate aminotransferase family protein [Pseudogracilibacillus auburnensis]|uniref:glutamate-1-semialdehyde 2,1-aminomutase n=1 Tax=Pseudogracilibacillus auburnensis TaxID=1494959 RepID=A0A2V3W1Q9_9BACI|nr:aspartate aminotransferase family protein [Pseudogracilibacillus auburnensis]PXW88012.1 glutamate-1-semialdehyde 2,1-aminomutase [Pseudogracilibacillus auburnensis]